MDSSLMLSRICNSTPASSTAGGESMLDDDGHVAPSASKHSPTPAAPRVVLPNVLIQKFLTLLFTPSDSLTERVAKMTTLKLVCKAWAPLAEAAAFAVLTLDTSNGQALSYLDPTAGPGRRLLSCIHSLTLEADEEATHWVDLDDRKEAVSSQVAMSMEPNEDSCVNSVSDEMDTMSQPGADGESLNDADNAGEPEKALASILASLPNLRVLLIQAGHKQMLSTLVAEYLTSLTWRELQDVEIAWTGAFSAFIPVISKVSMLPNLKYLLLKFYSDTPEKDGCTDPELRAELDDNPIKAVETLQHLEVPSFSISGKSASVLLALHSPTAPIHKVSWHGRVPSKLCRKLPKGTTVLRELSFHSHRTKADLIEKILPQLSDLMPRQLEKLVIDTAHLDEEMGGSEGASIGMLLDAVPPCVSLTVSVAFPGFGADLTLKKILDKTTVPAMTYDDDGMGKMSLFLRGKPLAQKVAVLVSFPGQMPDRLVFARYVVDKNPLKLSGWYIVTPLVLDAQGHPVPNIAADPTMVNGERGIVRACNFQHSI